MEECDVAVIGGGILGTSLAYWLASRYRGRVLVLEREARVGEHASGRNTGVIHRPFYLHPEERKVFARAAQASYPLWKAYATEHGLPWAEVGTLKVAMNPSEVKALEKNVSYATANGMDPSEVELLDPEQVARLEPNVSCSGALLAKTDTAVDYGALTRAIRSDAQGAGASFRTNYPVRGVETRGDGAVLRSDDWCPPVAARFVVNCAGGEAVDIAHAFGLATEYADLHFRGEYWIMDAAASRLVNRNVYTVPRQRELTFLDPHWIVRANGRAEIGPNAVPVPDPYAYEGLFRHLPAWADKTFEPPVANKLRLTLSGDFLGLAAREMLSSLSPGEMLRRVRRFIPRLRPRHLAARGTAGIRSNVVDPRGKMVQEAIEAFGPRSFHVLNYNSPGATGAPAYAAYLVDRLAAHGDLDHLNRSETQKGVWDWEAVASTMGLAA